MRDLKIREVKEISGGPVIVIPPIVKGIAAIGALIGGAFGGHAIGQQIGEAVQREHEIAHQCTNNN